MSMRVEILAIGNELLQGDVLDTNSHWLCKQLTGLGARVEQVCQLADSLDTISDHIRAALERETRLLLTTGGLGPTDDDLTLPAVAQALGLELEVHPQALEWVAAKYHDLAQQGYVSSATMTPSRVKMARLPRGAEPLQNNVGAAPGMLLHRGQALIVSLPGVPEELEDIFKGSLRPHLQVLLGEGAFVEWKIVVDCGDESVLAPLLRPVVAQHPAVYVKSRAKRFEKNQKFVLTLSARGATPKAVVALVQNAWQALEAALAQAGIVVFSVTETA